MEVLFFNLSLKLAIPQALSCLDPEQPRERLPPVPSDARLPFVKAHFAFKTSRLSSYFVLAGFTVNECRLLKTTRLNYTPWTQS